MSYETNNDGTKAGDGETAYRSGTRKNRTGAGVILLLLGMLFLTVLGNLFIDSVGTYTYVFLPLPIIGILYTFVDRKRYNGLHGSLSSFSLILIIVFFLLYLATGLMYKYFLGKVDLRWARNVIYLSEGMWMLAHSSCIISLIGLEDGKSSRLAISAMSLSTLLVIISILLIQTPATEMMDDIEDIQDDEVSTDMQKKMKFDESVDTFREDSSISRLFQALAGIIVMVGVVVLGLKPLSDVKDNIIMRFRRALTERRP